MKKKAFLIMAAVVCALLLIGMATKKAEAFDIKFDGFCDGMNLNLDLPRLWGVQTGSCIPSPQAIIGDIAGVPGEGKVLAVSTTFASTPGNIYTYYIRLDNTFTNYVTNGTGPPVKINDGTWSIGAPAAAAAGLPSSVPVE
jgi:hypothetical protein